MKNFWVSIRLTRTISHRSVGPSNLSLPNNAYIKKPNQPPDCTAHFIVYNVALNTVCPLLVQTDTWCSLGSLIPNETLVQTGGYHEGDHMVHTFTPCNDSSCDWTQLGVVLDKHRWYMSNQLLPNECVISLVVDAPTRMSFSLRPTRPRPFT